MGSVIALITAAGALVGVFTSDLASILKLKAILETNNTGSVQVLQQFNADASTVDQDTIAAIKAWATANHYTLNL